MLQATLVTADLSLAQQPGPPDASTAVVAESEFPALYTVTDEVWRLMQAVSPDQP